MSSERDSRISPDTAIGQLWRTLSLDATALQCLHLSGHEPVLPSSFAVSTAAQASIAAAALAAAETRYMRGHGRQKISVDMRHAAQECATYYTVDGKVPQVWDKLSGLYACKVGWVRIHANFAHHRDGALALLGCPTGEATQRDEVTAALQHWAAQDFEEAASGRGLAVAALRTFAQWDIHPQAHAVNAMPLIAIERIADAPPRKLEPLQAHDQPLAGLRVLDLTRILAGPVGTRALAAYGADVMLISSPNLPNVGLPETSRGKLSAHVDLLTPSGRERLSGLVRGSHFFVQGYRPGGIAAAGFGPAQVAQLSPGVIYGSLSAYGPLGPWSQRRGFDSLVQTAMGFNDAEGRASVDGQPRALPVQILDHATGYLLALGMLAAFMRQQREGGSWHVQVSLARTGKWLRSLGRVDNGLLAARPDIDDLLEESDTGFGRLVAVRHSARFGETPARLRRPSMPPGSHPPDWSQIRDSY